MTTETDDQLRQHLRTLAQITTPSPEEIERDVRGRAARRRRRRRAAPVLGGLAAAGLTVVAVTVLSGDDPADVRVADDTSSSASPLSEEQPSPRITAVRLGRHDGFDRVVVEFNANLPDTEVAEVDDVATQGGSNPAFSVDDTPNYGECEPEQLDVEGSGYVNVVVPSDWLRPADAQLEPRYRSRDTVTVDEVAVCGPYEGRAHLTIALSQPGEVETSILDDPGRVVIDIR